MLVAGALTLTVLDYRGAVSDRQRAADAIEDAAATQAAGERPVVRAGALGDALLGPGPLEANDYLLTVTTAAQNLAPVATTGGN